MLAPTADATCKVAVNISLILFRFIGFTSGSDLGTSPSSLELTTDITVKSVKAMKPTGTEPSPVPPNGPTLQPYI